MTYGAFTQDFASFDKVAGSRKASRQTVSCAVALTLSTSVGLWMLYAGPDAAPLRVEAPSSVPAHVEAQLSPARVEEPPAPARTATPPTRLYGALLDPGFTSGYNPVNFAKAAPLRSSFGPLRQQLAEAEVPAALPQAEPQIVPQLPPMPKLVTDIPMPVPRPALLQAAPVAPGPSAGRRIAETGGSELPPIPVDHRTFFQKLFTPSRPSDSVLAYAAPEDGGLGTGQTDVLGRPLPYDRYTAVYDIAAHTVYLPGGARLEAHSGLGVRLDDPRGVAERMRGPTPPNVYELAPREQLFHGVRALRLNPVGGGTTYGRGGLLAHTYMLGPRGDSNGCVVFKDYKAFLQAYDAGEVRRLVVVARMN